MSTKKYREGAEKRSYIRLESVFPVEFRLVDNETRQPITDWKQGFTSNISKGGICLSINNVDDSLANRLTSVGQYVFAHIDIPLTHKPVPTYAKIAWATKTKDEPVNQYLIGIMFTDIEPRHIRRMVGHARWMHFIHRLSVYLIVGLVVTLAGISFYNWNLRLENRRLVATFVETLQRDSATRGQLTSVKDDKERLERVLGQSNETIANLTQQLGETQLKLSEQLQKGEAQQADIKESQDRIKQLRDSLAALTEKRQWLEGDIQRLSTREDSIKKTLGEVEQSKTQVQGAAVDKMYQWLCVHQNPRSGLVASFEGDPALSQLAFTYDQALAAQAYTLFGDYERAQAIFNFFDHVRKDAKKFSGFTNAYYANSGDVAEYTVHCGPNIWLGIAVLQYAKASNDARFMPIAQAIADWVISVQEQDPEGGLRGGPDVRWFATEHNLDAYAFFTMMYETTGNDRYDIARKKTLNWLTRHAYDRPEVPVKRGKGDATIATDTYAWSIAALGPELLGSLGMNPDEIMQFAVDNCEVSVNFRRPDGKSVQVRGFDFAKHANMARGGVVSSEWSAQMVMSFKIMSDYYRRVNDGEKAQFYAERAASYLNEMGKLVISSSSPTGQGQGCLPYATAENADTGHGWRTPLGNRTGSVAGTAYALFAYKDYNPLQLEK